jgi:Carboxypeptidase regulatory-like domain
MRDRVVLRQCAHRLIIDSVHRLTMRYLNDFFSLLYLIPTFVGAQAANDVLAGRVTDLTGRPVADAQIVAIALGSGTRRSQTTDPNGRYRIYFPEIAPKYTLVAKRIGFSPIERTIVRHTSGAENMIVDLQFGGTPLALSAVEIGGGSSAPDEPRPAKGIKVDWTLPNPIADILALRDTLHLSAVQVIALTDLSDTLVARNSRIYGNIRSLLAKSEEAGEPTLMAGSVAMMLEEASGNTSRAVAEAGKLLRPEQWLILPASIRARPDSTTTVTAN